MASTKFGGFLQQLRKAMAAETLASHSDCQLIERFLTVTGLISATLH